MELQQRRGATWSSQIVKKAGRASPSLTIATSVDINQRCFICSNKKRYGVLFKREKALNSESSKD